MEKVSGPTDTSDAPLMRPHRTTQVGPILPEPARADAFGFYSELKKTWSLAWPVGIATACRLGTSVVDFVFLGYDESVPFCLSSLAISNLNLSFGDYSQFLYIDSVAHGVDLSLPSRFRANFQYSLYFFFLQVELSLRLGSTAQTNQTTYAYIGESPTKSS